MKFKYFLGICSIVFIIIGLIGFDGTALVSVFIKPLVWLGDILRTLSIHSAVGNLFSIAIYVLLVVSPIIYLTYRSKLKRVTNFEYLLLPLISLSIGWVLYVFINPHILYNSINEVVRSTASLAQVATLGVILTSGSAYILYIFVIIYLSTRAFTSKEKNGLTYFNALIHITIVVITFSVLALSLSNLISNLKTLTTDADRQVIMLKYVIEIIVSGLMVYLLLEFKDFIHNLDKNGFQFDLYSDIMKIYKLSFILLVTLLTAQAFIILFQFLVLEDLLNINFTFDIPIPTMIVVSIIFIASKYIGKSIEIKKENELFI